LLGQVQTACLGPLAEQLELVLKAVSQSVQRKAPDVAQSAVSTDQQARIEAKSHDAELEDEAPDLASTG
jgi:phage terminase Nu1 subunit (DNA packaging protein)